MSTQPSRDFKGLWIPREIWLHPKLSLIDKGIWSEIYSLHDRERGGCYAKDKYLTDFFGISRSYLQRSLKKLKDLGLLKTVSNNGREVVRLAVAPPADYGQQVSTIVDSSSSPEETSSTPPTLYYNKDEVSKSHCCTSSEVQPKKKKEVPKEAKELAQLLRDRIKSHFPTFKEPNLISWAKDMDKLIRLDKKAVPDIRRVIYWVCSDSFWQTNILSAKKLREKFDQLILKEKTSLRKEGYEVKKTPDTLKSRMFIPKWMREKHGK